MAFLFPSQPNYDHHSERFVAEYIASELQNNIICIHHINCPHELDLAVFIPNHGICVLEVKGWIANETLTVKDQNTVQLNRNGVEMLEQSPAIQARMYARDLQKKIRKAGKQKFISVPLICYPYISKEQFKQSRLDLIYDEQYTLLKDDFEQNTVFDKLIHAIQDRQNAESVSFTGDFFTDCMNLFMTAEQMDLYNNRNTVDEHRSSERNNRERENYSQWMFLPRDHVQTDEEVQQLVRKWSSGLKLWIFCESKELFKKYLETFKQQVDFLQLNSRKAFYEICSASSDFDSVVSVNIFNFQLFLVDSHNRHPYTIFFDGKKTDDSFAIGLLGWCDQQTSFNYNQYRIEHHAPKEHMLVRAGAGTGKTFSMISRINYLIYMHKIEPKHLRDLVILITFTRDAAFNMRKRLQESFENYYLLTRNPLFFALIEQIEQVRISTIHSLAKRVLRKFADVLGLSKEIRITTGGFDRKRAFKLIIDQLLHMGNNELKELLKKINISAYELQKRIFDIYEKLVSKNISVLELSEVNFADDVTADQEDLKILNKVIAEVICKGELEARLEFEKQDRIPLSDLMIRMNEIIRRKGREQLREVFSQNYAQHEVPLYVFVDEFQDTDNVQIDLLKEFQQLLDYHLFVVGDVKQCIYRFRGAEDQAFEHLLGIEIDDKRDFFEQVQKVDWGKAFILTKNYRTDFSLLEEMHKSFLKWGTQGWLNYNHDDRLNGQARYNDGLGVDEYLRLTSVSKQQLENDLITQVKARSNELRERNKKREADGLLSEEYTIALLVRTNSEVERIRKLGEKNILFIETETGGKLYQSAPALDLYKLVLALLYNRSPLHLFNLFSSNYGSSSEHLPKAELETLKRKYEEGKLTHTEWHQQLLETFDKISPIKDFAVHIHSLQLKPIMSVLNEIIQKQKPWDQHVSNIYNDKPFDDQHEKFVAYYRSNLSQLIEYIVTASNQDFLTLETIERSLRIMITTKQRETSRDDIKMDIPTQDKIRVVCTTVHKSKGLEFNTVFLPYADKDLDAIGGQNLTDVIVLGDSNQLKIGYKIVLNAAEERSFKRNEIYSAEMSDSGKELDYRFKEEVRILYVAMTRSIEQLVVLTTNQESGSKNRTWASLLK